MAVLVQCGLIDLDKLTQDGVRIRASAGATSYRRRATLEHHLARAQEVVEHLKREVHDDPAASDRRIRKARERAARERVERVAAALKTLGEVEAQRARREKTHRKQTEKQKEPRASTTDPEVRPAAADTGENPQPPRPAAGTPSHRRRVCGGRRHRMGSRRRRRGLLSTDPIQAWQ